MKIQKFLALAVLFLSCGLAQAQISSADFRTESNLPDVGSGAPLIYQRLGASVGAGYELSSSDFLSNASSWGGGVVFMDLDSVTNILTLTSQDTWDFKTFTASLTNIAGGTITGISLLSNNLTDIGVVPTLSYTDDSVLISYSNMPDSFNFTGQTASFQLSVAAVPEPSTYAMLLAGLGMLGFTARRRQA